jgi:antitoxin ParD1/3/4
MARSRSIVVDERAGAFVEAQVNAGRYATESEVLNDALRLLEEEQSRLETLRAALKEGEESGPSSRFDFDAFLSKKSI